MHSGLVVNGLISFPSGKFVSWTYHFLSFLFILPPSPPSDAPPLRRSPSPASFSGGLATSLPPISATNVCAHASPGVVECRWRRRRRSARSVIGDYLSGRVLLRTPTGSPISLRVWFSASCSLKEQSLLHSSIVSQFIVCDSCSPCLRCYVSHYGSMIEVKIVD